MEARIIDYNYSQLSDTVITATSSDPSFPASNIKNPIRTRVHRTSGYFVITSSNNKINFKESAGGGELTATLTAANYTPTTLAAEIKSQMEAVGGETYTVTYSSSTGKWTIATGGAYLDILWDTGTDTANAVGDTIGFDTSSDDTGALTYTGANIAIHTEEGIVFDLQTTEAIDSVVLLFDSIRGKRLTESAVVRIQANGSDSWASPAVDQVLTVDDTYGIATHFFSSDQSYRYWRLEIVDPQNPDLYVETSTLVLGKGISLDDVPANGFTDEVSDQSEIEETDYGHRYADIRPLRRELSIDYPGLTNANILAIAQSYRRVGAVSPVLVAIDPLAESWNKDRFVFYGFYSGSQSYSHISGTFFTVPVDIVEAL